ncbi:tetratricopeptide repeat protein, partial [bacterium]|nr:tetratricopeptide repeat protein [bacterium]
ALDLAQDLYKECLHIKPNSAETYMLLGNAHYLKGEIEQAMASYKAAINISPENDEFRLIYSQIADEYIDKKRAGEPV